ncbi:MAG: phosphopantetheine adenylyltransferase [Candidatus Bathyarchaeia archaeon]
MERKFKIVAVGGTFDEFHKGHRALILKAFEVGEHVLIGLCTDALARKLWKNHEIAPYEERLEELRKFLERKGLLPRAEILPLGDPYGPSVTDREIEALVVSRETEQRAYEINEIRMKRGLSPLKIVVIEMVPAEDQISISSTRIHLGEIDREGRLLSRRDI